MPSCAAPQPLPERHRSRSRVCCRPHPAHKPTDADILSVLCDLFAGRTEEAFGESLDWWAETFQCDIGPRDAAGVVVAALSKWDFDRRAGAKGIAHLQEELVLRARRLIEAGAQS